MSNRSGFGAITFASDQKYIELAHVAGCSMYDAWEIPLTVVIPTLFNGTLPPTSEAINYIKQPFNWLGTDSRFEVEWQAIHASPYEHTIKIDADMLFFKDWDIPVVQLKELTDKGIHMLSAYPYTFRGEKMTSRYCRATFDDNKLPDVYSALFYFDKKQISWDFFARVRQIFIDWDIERLRLQNPLTRPVEASTDVVYAMALSDLNYDALSCELLKFVHMKSELNFTSIYGQTISEEWTRSVDFFVSDDGDFFIENYKQSYPLHYYMKSVGRSKRVKDVYHL